MKENYAIILEEFPSGNVEDKIRKYNLDVKLEEVVSFDDFLSQLEKDNDISYLVLGNMADVFKIFMKKSCTKRKIFNIQMA